MQIGKWRLPWRRLIVLSLSLMVSAYCGRIGVAQVAKLHPVDEAAKDPSFFIFRAQLLKVIQQRDSASLYSILSPGIKNSFGGDDGVPSFKRMWTPERSTSRIWSELLAVLALGGRFEDERTFMAPYTYSNFPDKFDAFEHGTIIGENVRVRQKPGTDKPIITTLSFEIVKVTDWNFTELKPSAAEKRWVAVTLADGRQGYVAGEYVRSPIDYRAIFNKQNGKWLMTVFVAGD